MIQKQHIPDVLNGPVSCAQRFHLADTQMGDDKKAYRYLALYEIQTNDLAGVFKKLATRRGTPDYRDEQRALT
jgi:hypothetical protein